MKKSIFIFALAACAAAVFSCTKEEPASVQDTTVQESAEGFPFKLSLTTDETKTVADGYNVNWMEGDAIRVFHAEAGTQNFVDDGKFVYGVDGASFFTGETAEFIIPGFLYDWYVIYPYSDTYTSPKDGIFTATVTEKDPSLAGNAPLYGSIKELDGMMDVAIPVHQLMSVLKFNIKNNGFEPFYPTKLILNTEGHDFQISGDYKLDITGNAPVFTGRNSEEAYSGGTQPKYKNLEFESIMPISEGETATYYCTVPAFTIAENSLYYIYLYAEDKVGYFKKYLNFDSAVELKAGEVTTINANLDKALEISEEQAVSPVRFEFFKKAGWNNYYAGKSYKPVHFLCSLDKNITNDFFQGSLAGSTDVDNLAYRAAIKTYINSTVGFTSNANRFYFPTQAMGNSPSDFNMQIEANYAKIPAGKKVAFYCSLYANNAASSATPTCDKWTCTFSFDGGKTFVPAKVEANEAYCDEIRSDEGYIDLKAETANMCYPVKITAPAAASDLEHAKVIFKISREPDGTYGGHFGIAPYYKFTSEEGLRLYSKANSDADKFEGEWSAFLKVE